VDDNFITFKEFEIDKLRKEIKKIYIMESIQDYISIIKEGRE